MRYIFLLLILFIAMPVHAQYNSLENSESASSKIADIKSLTKEEQDKYLDALVSPVRDINARNWALQVKYKITTIQSLSYSSVRWPGSRAENDALMDLIVDYVNKDAPIEVTPEEWDKLDESKRKVQIFLNGGKEVPAVERRRLRNKQITKILEPTFEIDAQYWAWRIAKEKDTTYDELFKNSFHWIGEMSRHARLLKRIKENLETGNTNKLTDEEYKRMSEAIEKSKAFF